MITQLAKFTGLLQIATDKNATYLTNIITPKEADLLYIWFGYAIAKELLKTTPSPEYQTLIDGVEYTDTNGDLQYLTGLSSLLPYLMYFYIVRDQQTQNSEIGELDAAIENATKGNVNHKLCENYNIGVKYLNQMLDYINDNDDVYTTAVLCKKLETINIFGI